jgi:oligopeptide transport system permease protein
MNEPRPERVREERGVHHETFSDRVDDRADELASAAAGGDIEQVSLWRDAWRGLLRNPFFLVGALLFVVFTVMALAPQAFTSVDPRACSLDRSGDGPQPGAPFGYDGQGCDYFSNVVHGARISLSIGFLAVLGTLAIGVVVGALAGYYGG